MTLKRENWKGKYFIVARSENGKIISRVRYTKDKSINEYRRAFSRTKDLSRGVSRRRFTKVYEIKDDRKRPYLGRQGYNYYVTIRLKDGTKITAKSMRYDTKSELKASKKEAEENVYMRVAEHFGLEYDADEGRKALSRRRFSRKEGIVRYANI